MQVPFLPQLEIALDLGSAVTKVMAAGKIVWEQPTCLAIASPSQAVVSIGDAAFSLLGKEPLGITVVFPIKQAEIVDRAWFHAYLMALKLQINSLLQIDRWTQRRWQIHLPSSLHTAAHQVFTKECSQALGSVRFTPTQIALKKLILKKELPLDGAVIVMGAQTTGMFVIAHGDIIMSDTLAWGIDELQDVIDQVLVTESKIVASRATLQQMLSHLASVSTVGREAQKSMVIQAKSVEQQSSLAHIVTSIQFAPHVRVALQDFFLWLQGTMMIVPEEVQKSFLSNGVMLAGGGAQLSGLVPLISEQLHCPVQVLTEPGGAVVRGVSNVLKA